jgi:hypothetical protein
VLLAVATLERDNMVAGWKTAKARATERGAKIGPTPFGYQRADEDDGVLQPHPDLGPVVTRAFDIAARVRAAAAAVGQSQSRRELGDVRWLRRGFPQPTPSPRYSRFMDT